MNTDDISGRLDRIEATITPGVQRGNPASETADVEEKLNVEREERDEAASIRRVEAAAKLASLKVIEDAATAAAREKVATALAFERGQEQARIEAHLTEHDRHFEANNGDIKLLLGKVEKLGESVGGLLSREEARDKVAAALAAAVKKSAADQLGSRQFFIGLAGLFVAVLAVLVAAGTI